MSQILIFTGKGGVGKTSIAAAHAKHSAQLGQKTLIVSTDMAHNLGDIFQVKLGPTATAVMANLDVLEIDPNHLMANDYQDMKNAVIAMIASTSPSTSPSTNPNPFDDISIFPGMDELFALLKIMDLHSQATYDRIIVDCAPTGETLSLLKFPEMLAWYMEKLFPLGKIAMRVLAPISKTLFKVQLPDHAALNDMEKLYLKLTDLQKLLRDRTTTAIRLVTMPEKMVVEETKRNYMYMNLYNFNVDGLYINRILPKDLDNPFFNHWIQIQNQHMETLEAVFPQVPIYKIPWFDTDLVGLDSLDPMIDGVFSNRDVFALIDMTGNEQYEQVEGGYRLTLNLPFIEKGAMDLSESGTDIIVKIGNFKRCIPKPASLSKHQITGAKLEDSRLCITFMEG